MSNYEVFKPARSLRDQCKSRDTPTMVNPVSRMSSEQPHDGCNFLTTQPIQALDNESGPGREFAAARNQQQRSQGTIISVPVRRGPPCVERAVGGRLEASVRVTVLAPVQETVRWRELR